MGHHSHSAGAIDARRFQRLAHRRVSENHRHIEFGHGRQEAVVLVLLDDQDVVSGGGQITDDADANRTQSDDDDVVAHMACPSESGSLDEPARQQQVRKERDEDGGNDHAAEHHADGEQSQHGGLLGEAEIAVADGRNCLGGEVQGVDPRHPRVAGR